MSKIVYAVIAVAVIAGAIVLTDWLSARSHSKAVEQYTKDKAAYTALNDQLAKKLLEQTTRADAAEQRALVAEKQVPALEAELARFGEAGKKAVARQDEAKKNYEQQTKTILSSTDACAVCRQLCADREAVSDISSPTTDYRCPATFCDSYCAGH